MKDDIVLNVNEDERRISIAIATIDCDENRRTPSKFSGGWFGVFYKGDLPLGRHEIDPEESNIDILTIYY